MNKKILMTGDFTSIHIYNYIKNVIVGQDMQCVGFHYKGSSIPPNYLEFYLSNNINIIYALDNDSNKNRGSIYYIKECCKRICALGHFDYLHVHQVNRSLSLSLFLCHHQFSKIIITYWGSDLYRNNGFKALQTVPILNVSDKITMITDDMQDYFNRRNWLFRRNSKKISVIDFGSLLYDYIEAINSRKDCKIFFNADPNKVILVIGYNGTPDMQQLLTLESITSFLSYYGKDIHIIVPAYGIEQDRYTYINKFLSNFEVDYSIYTDFMSPEIVAKLRVACDIFVHPQTTDALSGTMLEYLFSGSIVINGAWLKYSILDKEDVYYKTFDSFENLSDILVETLNNFECELYLSSQNKEKIAKISSWKYLKEKWLALFD